MLRKQELRDLESAGLNMQILKSEFGKFLEMASWKAEKMQGCYYVET
jgi:hypothetical protein